MLEAAGLRALFEVLVCMEDVEQGKPDPEGYLEALSGLNSTLSEPVAAADVLVFEDSEQGLRAALAAGMRCVVIAGTASPERLTGAAAIVGALDWSIPEIGGMFDAD